MKFIPELVVTTLFAVLTSSASYACHGGETPRGESPRPGDKTAIYCNEENTACAFLWFQSAVNTQDPGRFVLEFTGVENHTISDVKVGLWMEMEGHGHGSAPVELQYLYGNAYQVDKAYFVMPAEWKVEVRFALDGERSFIAIPVFVEK